MTGYQYGVDLVLLREERDRFGDVTLVEEGVLPGCAQAPRTRTADTEDTDRAAQVSAGRTIWVRPESIPEGVRITAHHRVRYPDGEVWQVRGAPGDWRSPYTGWHPGFQVELERTTG